MRSRSAAETSRVSRSAIVSRMKLALHGVEGHVAREQHVVSAEELVGAAAGRAARRTPRCRRRTRRKASVGGPSRPLSTRSLSSSGVLAPKLSIPGPTRPEKKGTRPPAWWVMILQVGVAREDAGEDQPGHEHRGVVGPAERPPDLVLRLLLGQRVVRPGRVARRVNPDRPVQLGHAGEHRLERAGRPAARRSRACRSGSPARPGRVTARSISVEGGVHVVQRQPGHEADERSSPGNAPAPPSPRWRAAPARPTPPARPATRSAERRG